LNQVAAATHQSVIVEFVNSYQYSSATSEYSVLLI
tara:strand:- start:8450 stop:8554 length:105 start_codon:yes stop_codon:yes gene_type:complete